MGHLPPRVSQAPLSYHGWKLNQCTSNGSINTRKWIMWTVEGIISKCTCLLESPVCQPLWLGCDLYKHSGCFLINAEEVESAEWSGANSLSRHVRLSNRSLCGSVCVSAMVSAILPRVNIGCRNLSSRFCGSLVLLSLFSVFLSVSPPAYSLFPSNPCMQVCSLSIHSSLLSV